MNDGFDDSQWLSVCDAILAGKSLVDAARMVLNRFAEPFVASQQRFQSRAAKRFSHPERRLWTNQLLEQASDEHSADLTASYFPEGATIYDFCCGAGADAVSLARRGKLVAVDRSPVAVALTKVNLAWNGCQGTVRCESVEAVEIPSDACVHIDPDRRSGGNRTTSVEWFEPSVDILVKLISHAAIGSIKVAPATRLKEFIDAAGVIAPLERPIDKIGVEFISWGGDVRQQRWWWNVDAFPPGSTTVSVMQNSGVWTHWTANQSLDHDYFNSRLDDRDELQEYESGFIGDADGALRAAALQQTLAEQSNAVLLGSTNGYLLKHDLNPPNFSGLVDWFRIEAILPFDRKKLRAYLRDRQVGTLEIKTRRIEVSVDALRKEMKLEGDQSKTLLLTKCNGRAVAVVARRVTTA